MKKTIVIIGSGIGGLATAALLAKDGHHVTVVEKNNLLGGRAQILEKDGFLWDRGPSWYLMPEIFEHYFSLFGKKTSDYYTLKKLDPQYRVYFGKKDFVDISSDKDKNLNYFESLEPGARENVSKYLDKAEYQYNLAVHKFLYKNYHNLGSLLDPRLMEGFKLNAFENLDHHIKRYTQNKRIQQILGYTNVFLGGSPKTTPALFSMMSHIDFNQGVYYPDGGINKIISALVSLCKEYGVIIKTNTEVKKIIAQDKKVVGVKVQPIQHPLKPLSNGDLISADIVVSNGDLAHTNLDLLEQNNQDQPQAYWDKAMLAPSAYMLYLGIKGKVKGLQHHTLFFDNNWEEHFDEVFNNPVWPDKPSYYICTPSKTDPSVAPKDCENVFVLVPVASGLNDSDELRASYREKILIHLEDITGEEIKSRIISETIHTHRDFKSMYNAYKGTALGLSHTLFQSAMFRPSVKSKKVQGLYYVGQYVQPGIGMPICLIGAELVQKEISS
jgi:1-hydroxy-2-isopentenylcarotenoid 3,4-desaturase